MFKEKTYKQIEQSRNRRLWVTQVILPGITAGAMLYSNPEIKRKVDCSIWKVKNQTKIAVNKLKSKFKKEGAV